jgi:hypothetical protein
MGQKASSINEGPGVNGTVRVSFYHDNIEHNFPYYHNSRDYGSDDRRHWNHDFEHIVYPLYEQYYLVSTSQHWNVCNTI